MDDPKRLILRDVRCFQGEQQGALRPITLLVGENSTGKTTFLGCYGVLHRVLSRPYFDHGPDFNEEPFPMGSFRDVVRSRRGPGGRIDAFELGLEIEPADGRTPPYTLRAAFREQGSQPVVSSLRFDFDSDSFLELQRSADGTTFRIPDRVVEAPVPFGEARFTMDFLTDFAAEREGIRREFSGLQPVAEYLGNLFRPPEATASRRRRAKLAGVAARYVADYNEATASRRRRAKLVWPSRLPGLIPVAPLRSKPRRTYDPVRETASPEGEHVPMLMMRLSRTEKGDWTSLHDGLVDFGRGSGLFSDIKVKRHGKQTSDPFQLQVKVRSGPHANIMDVGYGVSQSLPILVDVLAAGELGRSGPRGRRAAGRTFLLQQPEVHLHPRGQAELASLFVEACGKRGNRFLIETHSDYVIDRIRISVRKGLLKPDDVSILYFEPAGSAVTIHNLTLDEDGNLRNAPASYRDFFVKETDSLLGFAD